MTPELKPKTLHRDLHRQYGTRGIQVEDCRGEVMLQDSIEDPVWDTKLHRSRNHLVGLFRCDACGKAISVDLDSGRLLNEYPADPATMSRSLAEAFQVQPPAVPDGHAAGAERPEERPPRA